MASINDPNFKYTRHEATDIRKTFARVRREQAAAAKQQPQPPAQTAVHPIRRIAGAKS